MNCKISKLVADRYIAENPIMDFSFHAVSLNGFCMQVDDGRFILDFLKKYPDAQIGKYAFAKTKIFSPDVHKAFSVAVNLFSPMMIFLNGEMIYDSACLEEVTPDLRKVISAPLKKGYNEILVRAKKAATGFGCIFGSDNERGNPRIYLASEAVVEGEAGFSYSQLTDNQNPDGLEWYPKNNSVPKPGEKGIYYSYTKFKCEEGKYCFDSAYINGNESDGEIQLESGTYDLIIKSDKIYRETSQNGKYINPFNVFGTNEKWIHLGPFSDNEIVNINDLTKPYMLHHNKYWRLATDGYVIRPYATSGRFGKWNYPLGVTLYGIYTLGKRLEDKKYTEYAKAHIDLCVNYYEYSLWDKERFGFPSLNHKLNHMIMLDDCGSVGSIMLESINDNPKTYDKCKKLAEVITDYILNRLEKREDGAMYRLQHGVHRNTLWADDMYMGMPFMIRYYKLMGDMKYMDFAAEQFLLFKKYLFMEEENLVSHVYNFEFNIKNDIPWGRGNGWVLFSLSELLEKMPEKHPKRTELLTFFREFSEGILNVQDNDGRWHQVLNDPSSYLETSCTCMFTYAFSKGVRLGFYKNSEEYRKSAKKAVESLKKNSIDEKGNVNFVCWGSQYSFDKDYYKFKLRTKLNDDHGIGIIILAITEYERTCSV